ncbi:MAG: type 4a pilus biogenesis protein PilO [Gammaproteobacteria bacterium]|nr:type 4a pilus biogenesis protein PilO [Gammaproteobacteria bacterium]
MNWSELQNLDLSEVGDWPVPIKTGAVILVCAAVLAAGVWFDAREQMTVLESAQKKEIEIKEEYEIKQHKAANLEDYKEQMVEMERDFGTMLRQLPSKTEVAELLVDISQAGLSNGLEFELFKPEREKPIEFYAELPIKIVVKGSYHEFGKFVSDVVALPRIVTLQDISIKKKDDKSKELTMNATATTYRYFEEESEEGDAGG